MLTPDYAEVLLIPGGSGDLEARALRWAQHVLASQGALPVLLIGKYVRRREQAGALLGGAWVLLLYTLGSAPLLVGFYLTGVVPPGPAWMRSIQPDAPRSCECSFAATTEALS